MSFTTNKSTVDGTPHHGGLPLSRGGVSTAAFRPQVIRSMRMHPLLAFGVGAAVFVALVGYALFQKLTYQAVSQVYEEPAAARLLSDSSAGVFDANKYETFLSEQMQLVQRLDVLMIAVKSLPRSTWAEYGATPQRAAETLQQQMKVVRVGTSYQISISLKGTDPQNTADLVNAVTTAYLAAVHKATIQDSDERAQLLAEERQRIETELSAGRAEQAVLGASIGVATPTGEGGNPYDAQLSGIRAQLTEARAAHDMAAAQLAALSGLSPARTSGLTAAADEVIAGDPGLGSLKATISARKAQLNEQMAGMTPTNPVYKQDQDEIAALDKSLDAMTSDLRGKAARRLQDKLRSDLERTGDVEARLNGDLSRQIATATSAAPKLQRASELGGDIQRLMLREAAVDDALRGLRLESNGPSQVRLSLAAAVPESPEANRKKLLLLAALPLAMLMGAFAAVFARKQDTKIYSGQDIDEVVGFPPMAVLPARGDVSELVFEEYVLRLAAGVESAYRTSGARTFLLTAVSLTTDIEPVATALVRKFGEIGVNAVVATAADMLTPVQGSVPGNEAEPGLSLELGNEGFVAANMARIKAEHGLVLIESQALANCAQTEYVARCADATVLLIECGVTTREELFRAAELLERLNVTGIGAVLEELQLRFADGEFRKAIEALDRRQSGRVQSGRARTAARVVARPQRTVEVPQLDQMVEAPAEETSVPVGLEPEAPAPQERVEELAEAPVEAAVVAPEVIAEVIAMPAVIPISAERVEELVRMAPTAAGRRAGAAAGPVLVSSEPVPVWAHAEKFEEEPVIALANGTSDEKMAPKLSARRGSAPPDGDVRMAHKTSWINRLLGRDEEPVVSILAEDDDKNQTRGSARAAARMADIKDAEQKADDFDIPPASLVSEISRQRATAPSEPQARGARLSIVPQEPAERSDATAETSSTMPDGMAVLEQTPADMDVVAEPHGVAKDTPEEMEQGDPGVHGVKIWPDGTPLYQVSDLTPHVQVEAGAAEPVVVDAEIAAEGEPDLMPEPVQAQPIQMRPRRPISFPELADLAESLQPSQAGMVDNRAKTAPEVVEQIGAASPHYASAPEAIEPEAEEATLVEAVPLEPPVTLAGQPKGDEASGIHEVVRQEVPEAHEVEPVHQEASRGLGAGRWDPIPPLRSSVESWRDRPSPVPVSKAPAFADRVRQTGVDKEVVVPNRWVPEPEGRQPEPLAEPTLSRQWGLLSKFQQAKISSQRPIAQAEAEPERDASGQSSSNGSGKR